MNFGRMCCIGLLLVQLTEGSSLCFAQPIIEWKFNMTPYNFVYMANPTGCSLTAYMNRERYRLSRVKTCLVTEKKVRGKKVIQEEEREQLFHYDTSGYPVQWDYYVGDSQNPRTDERDQRAYLETPFYSICRDSMSKVVQEKFLSPPESLSGMKWPGFGNHTLEDIEAVGGVLDTSYFDSCRGLRVFEYFIRGGYAQKVIHFENADGEIIEVEGFFHTGRQAYFKRRIRTRNGFESQLIEETPKGDYIRSYKYDSLGYRYFEGYEYLPHDSTRRQLRIAKKFNNYKVYVYDELYYLQSILHYARGRILERKDYYYDENRNLIREVYQFPGGQKEIAEFSYTYYE